ncbi:MULTISPECIES: hypothetical protein [Pseudomonas]|uniref:DUF3077 domain-containing protein n=1 Tax=Pseudomonas putida TaxID=303 RepID=A0AAW5HLS2_PSEPU|nr:MULTISPECIES: hypothetical protein [Pseudomonas]MCO1622791.1 hypothetical protein [Pseudomonas putida]HEE9762293.1 hypothetical protein [Pseudomonas putida]
MKKGQEAPKLALVKGGAEPVLEALAQRAAKQSGMTTQQRPDSTHTLARITTPGRPSYDDLHTAVDEAHAMVSLLATGLRMIAAGYGTHQEVIKLAKSSVKAAEATKGFLGLVLDATGTADGSGE